MTGIQGVVYRVTVESPEHATYEFTSWTHNNPYAAATSFYNDLSSECARIDEHYVTRTEPTTIRSRGYGGGNGTPECDTNNEGNN